MKMLPRNIRMAATPPPLDHHSLNDCATGPFFKQSPKVTEAPVNCLGLQLRPVWQSHTRGLLGEAGLTLGVPDPPYPIPAYIREYCVKDPWILPSLVLMTMQ